MMLKINRKRKTGIQRKIALMIFLATFIIMSIGIGLIYFFGFNLIRSEIGKQHIQLCNMLGTYINEALRGEVEDAKTYATRPLWIDALKDANIKKDRPPVKEYLENRVSLSMKDILHVRGNIAQLFMTNLPTPTTFLLVGQMNKRTAHTI